MKLTATKRAGETKGETKKMRREGNIPAVYYPPGQPGLLIEVNGEAFDAALRQIKPGRLSTTVFEMEIDGKKTKALIKDIQYDLTTYKVIHLDFLELHKDVPVKVNVPIEFVGVADCEGVKLGGAIRQIIRKVQVKCDANNIPEKFDIDVRSMKIKQARRLSDIAMPQGVVPVSKKDEVVVIIAKR